MGYTWWREEVMVIPFNRILPLEDIRSLLGVSSPATRCASLRR